MILPVLHGPQSGRPLQERRDWWEDTRNLLRNFAMKSSRHVLFDANAKTGPSCEPVVYNGDDASSGNTRSPLPCTTEIHAGPRTIWTAADVAIPQTELGFCTNSGVLEEFESGNCHDDHQVVALRLEWIQKRPEEAKKPARVCRHDRTAILTQLQSIDLSHICAADWEVDMESQVQSFNAAVHASLQAACPVHKHAKKKHFISDLAWKFRAEKLQLRRRLQTARKDACRSILRFVFWFWRERQSRSDEIRQQTLTMHFAHGPSIRCGIFRLTCHYATVARALKKELQQSRQRRLVSALADTDEKTAAGTLLHVLKSFLRSHKPQETKEGRLASCQEEHSHNLHLTR